MDEYLQGDPELAAEMQTAIEALRRLQLDGDHLVPSRVETGARSIAEGRPSDHLLLIVYDRPTEEGVADWVTLPSTTREGAYPRVEEILAVGAAVASRLLDLHRQKRRHGSLTPQAVVLRRNHVIPRTLGFRPRG